MAIRTAGQIAYVESPLDGIVHIEQPYQMTALCDEKLVLRTWNPDAPFPTCMRCISLEKTFYGDR